MAVDFLTEEQKARYGQYVEAPNDIQLARYFHLGKTDLAFITERRGDRNRFGFALQITSAQLLIYLRGDNFPETGGAHYR